MPLARHCIELKGNEMKKIAFASVFFLFFGGNIYALDFLGQPSARVENTNSFLGIGYVNSSIDIVTDDDMGDFGSAEFEIKDIDMDKYFFDLGGGTDDHTSFFFRIGAARAQIDRDENESNFAGYIDDSDDALLLGGGVKVTLYEEEHVKWGVSAQFTKTEFDFKKADFTLDSADYVDIETEGTLYEIMVSTGPTVIFNKYVSIYGGPFLHFIRGEIEAKGLIDTVPAYGETDVREDSIAGGFVGVELTFGDKLSFSMEGQKTNSAAAVGGSLCFRF